MFLFESSIIGHLKESALVLSHVSQLAANSVRSKGFRSIFSINLSSFRFRSHDNSLSRVRKACRILQAVCKMNQSRRSKGGRGVKLDPGCFREPLSGRKMT